VTDENLLDSKHWSDLFVLLGDLDREIASLYAEAGIDDVRTRFVGSLIELSRRGPMTIQELADRREVTHSAMSQTAAAMRTAGLVESAAGTDRRTRKVKLTARAEEVVPFLKAEWQATEATVRALDAELPYSLTQVVQDIRAALQRRPYGERLRENLARFQE
jgi:DNA-binding MarR family transcriptional regulator